MQRFVKVDLLGGFAVFGTIMLLISAAFSLALQDDYWVQMKGTVLGLLTASLFMIDGLLRRGAYFGARIERYMPLPLHHDRIAIGIAGSQKTLMVGLNTAVELNRSILPMLLFHICQLVFDTLIADYWAKNNDELVTPEV